MSALFRVIPAIVVTPAMLDDSNVAEDDHAAWNSGTTYAAEARVIKAHRVWESAQAGNTNHDPEADDGTWWIDVNPTNRWRMFDRSVGLQTENAASIEVEITIPERITDLAFQNVDAASIDIEMRDSAGNTVYGPTNIPLTETPFITSHFDWLFTTPVRKRDLVLRLPPYRDATLIISINEPDGTAKCGDIIVGRGFDIGTTQWGYELGSYDYSDFATDAFGKTDVVARDVVRLGTFEVLLDRAYESELHRQLQALHATLALYVGLPDVGATQILGFYQSMRTVSGNLAKTRLAIEIRGVAPVSN